MSRARRARGRSRAPGSAGRSRLRRLPTPVDEPVDQPSTHSRVYGSYVRPDWCENHGRSSRRVQVCTGGSAEIGGRPTGSRPSIVVVARRHPDLARAELFDVVGDGGDIGVAGRHPRPAQRSVCATGHANGARPTPGTDRRRSRDRDVVVGRPIGHCLVHVPSNRARSFNDRCADRALDRRRRTGVA